MSEELGNSEVLMKTKIYDRVMEFAGFGGVIPKDAEFEDIVDRLMNWIEYGSWRSSEELNV